MPKILTNIKIDEVSAVDRGAGEGVKIMLMKRAKPRIAVRDAFKPDGRPDFEKIFGVEPRKKFKWYAPRKNLDVAVEPADDDEGMPDDDVAARVDAEMDTDSDSTPHFLAGTPDKPKGKQTMKTFDSNLTANVVKKYGIVAFAKAVEAGQVHVSESELTKLIGEAAERAGTTFAKMYTANGEEGIALRKAIIAARDTGWAKAGTLASSGSKLTPATLTPNVVNVPIGQTNDPRKALKAIQDLVAEQRAKNKDLTEAGAWDAVYSNPKNALAVAAERAESRGLLPQ